MSRFIPAGMGWLRDLPDFRDYTPDHRDAIRLLRQIEARTRHRGDIPRTVDLREFFSSVDDQGGLRSCSSFAVLGLVEYFESRLMGKNPDASSLFLYQMTLKLRGIREDAGADLRTTLKALHRFGTPPQRHWPYGVERLAISPQDGFLFSFSQRFRLQRYVRLDASQGNGTKTLRNVKQFLAAGFPSAFGFPVPGSLTVNGDIPFRPEADSVREGQAALAVGYDDARRIGTNRGALLIRNSWGRFWGENGYGWLPYAYVENQIAVDFWTLLHPDWLETNELMYPLVS